MINHDQMEKALRRQNLITSDRVINALLNDLQSNPMCGFGVGGVTVWGDRGSIDKVRNWHHDATARLPYFERLANDPK